MKSTRLVIVAITVLLANPAGAAADELRVWTTRAIATVLAEVGAEFEQTTGHRLIIFSDLPPAFQRRFDAGEIVDVLISGSAPVDDWIRTGRIAANTRTEIARSGIGVEVRAGRGKPDISTVDAFKRALLNAKSIAYLKVGSGVYLEGLFERLGVSKALESKTTRPDTDIVSELVAKGEVELGMTVITQILTTPGVDLVGPLPADIQSYITFVAGVGSQSGAPKAASELIAFLRGPKAIAVIKAQGMEPAGQRQYIIATGRRLPYVYAVSLDAALDPANDRTSKAIVSRGKVATEAVDGRLLGDPANLVVSEDGRTVYVVNHHGAIDNATFRQHGGRGQIAVLDIDDLLSPQNDGTANALRRHMDSGGFGALGIVLLPETLIIANAENHLTEDGGNRITFVDRRTGSLRGTVELALGSPGFPCPDFPVPYVPPYGPPRNLAVRAPSESFGCFPNPNGLALGRAADGRGYVFSANGGTNDVSVIDLDRALRGDARAEIGRIPMQVGPWGITATPSRRHIIVANGGSQRDGSAGNTISLIDVDRRAEMARVRVGTDNPSEPSHPLIPSVTPDGRELIVPNVRANNVSIVNIERALAGQADAEVARIALVRPDGLPARPRGSAITADGRYAVISGGPSSPPFSQGLGHLYVIDLRSRRVVATVTGVGHEPYALAVVEK